MKKQTVVCRTCGSPAEIFNAKADENCIYFQCTKCSGIFMKEYQLTEEDSCATCSSYVKVLKANETYVWLQCVDCGGIFKSDYRIVQPVAISAE